MAKPEKAKAAPYEVEHYRYVPSGKPEKYNVVRHLIHLDGERPTLMTDVVDRNVSLPVARLDVRRRTFAAVEAREFKGEL